jgi:hypothetical protein
MFNNLKNLSFDGLPVDLGDEALLKILQRSPCLEKLEFLAVTLLILMHNVYYLKEVLIYNDE